MDIANPLLDSGISNPSILQVISNSLSYTLALFSTNLSSTGKLLNPSTRSVFLSQVAAHHKSTSYPTILCLSIHHAWLSGFLIIGSGAHASIFNLLGSPTSEIRHRDPIYSHLIWVCIAIGLHSFSLYCHNDTLEALGRPEDIFHDNSIQLKAIFAKQSFLRAELQPDIEMLDKKIIRITQELGTADFIVHHIHAFTIHVTLLILSKVYFMLETLDLYQINWNLVLLIPVMGQVEVVHVKYHLGITYS